MHTGVSSSWVVWHVFFERYTRVLMEASPEFPIHILKIYILGVHDVRRTRYDGHLPGQQAHLHAPLSQGTLRLSPHTAPRPSKAFDIPSVHEVHHRCSDEVFFSWLNALVQGSDQIIQGRDNARPA